MFAFLLTIYLYGKVIETPVSYPTVMACYAAGDSFIDHYDKKSKDVAEVLEYSCARIKKEEK